MALREIFEDDKTKRLSSTRVIAISSQVVGYLVVLIVVVGLLFGQFENADWLFLTSVAAVLLGGPQGIKAHQNQMKKHNA